VVIRNNEAELLNSSIPPYQPANAPKDYNPDRTRKLLLKKAEIRELIGHSAVKGLTIIPLKVYNRNNRLKLLLGLARHKKTVDKRETIKKRDTDREVRRTLKN
jgi:SsrA-binding protein